jgi:dihydroorotate dehydrogenase electron transfer subunit
LNQVWARVISNTEVMAGGYLVWLEAPDIASTASPGQFVMVRCGDELSLRRPLSIHKCEGDKIALLLQVVGKGTDWLSQRQAGSKLDLLGPLGNGYTILDTSPHLLLLSGGIGIAPLCFLAQEAVRQKQPVTLLLGASTAARLYPKDLLPTGIELITATEDGSTGKKGLLTEILPEVTTATGQIFACGPSAMYPAIARHQHSLKANSVQISLEMRMGCGLGVCYGCTVKTKNGLRQVCRDGPVFNLDDVLWDKLIS